MEDETRKEELEIKELEIKELEKENFDGAAKPAKSDKKRCPKCGSNMKLRHGEFGSYYGCSRFPVCNYTEKTGE